MKKGGITEWAHQPNIERILPSFAVPQTPKQVEKKLGVKKLKLKPYVEKGLLECLNPQAKKGRLYKLTENTRKLLELKGSKHARNQDWELVGWAMASPRQRLVILLVLDSAYRTSEEIRQRASRLNPNLTRISTKEVLKDLIRKNLVETELLERKRYYRIGQKGRSLLPSLHQLFT